MANSGYVNPSFLPGLIAASKQGTAPSPLLLAALNRNSNPDAKALTSMPMDYGAFLKNKSDAHAAANPSVVSRIFDILSRPLYAVGNAGYNPTQVEANHGDFMAQLGSLGHGIISGLAGTEKHTPADWIQQARDIKNQKATTGDTMGAGYKPGQAGPGGAAQTIGGLALNVGLDPLNVVKPIELLRGAGVNIPTIGDIASRAYKGTLASKAAEAASTEAGGLNAGLSHVSSKGIPQDFFDASKAAPESIASKLPTETPEKVIQKYANSTEAPKLGAQFKLSSILSKSPTKIEGIVNPATEKEFLANGHSVLKAKALATPLSEAMDKIKNDVLQKTIKTLGKNGAYDSTRQANVWNTTRGRFAKLFSSSGHGNTAANFVPINNGTFHIVSHVEKALEDAGHEPITKSGQHAKLTDVLQGREDFPHKLTDLVPSAIEKHANETAAGTVQKVVKAAEHAQVVAPTVTNGIKIANELTKNPLLSDPIKYLGMQRTGTDVHKAIVQLTGSTRAARVGKQVYNEIIKSQSTSSQEAVRKAAGILEHIVTTGKIPENYGKIVNDLGRGIAKEMGAVGPTASPEQDFLGRMATWYGQADLRQAVLAETGAASIRAAMTAKFYGDSFKGLNEAQAVEAMRAAQGKFIPANPAVAKAADAVRTRITDLFSNSGLKAAAIKGQTVAYRSGLTKEELNFELGRLGFKQKFTDGKIKDPIREKIVDYSKPGEWLNSWENWKIEGDPGKFLMQLEMATYNAMAKKALYQGFLNKFGSFSRNAEQNTRIKNFPQLAGHYFSPEVAQQLIRVNRDLFTNEWKSNKLLKMYDSIMRIWKTNMTIYAPSHSIRNMMGDIFNSWMAGVNNPRVYSKAVRVMAAHAHDYKDMEKLAPYLNPDKVPEILQKQMPASRVIVTTKDGQKITAAQIMIAARSQGILRTANELEDLGTGSLPRIKPLGGHVQSVAHGIVESVDHFTRLAHFIDSLSKARGPLDIAFREAGNTVRKFHPDGMDLTGFERNVLRRIIPFYSWTRKAAPFVIQGMVAKPAKFMMWPKISYAMSNQNGKDQSLSNQFPTDQMFPDWIRELGAGPIGMPGGILNKLVGGPQGYVESSPSIPSMDILQQYGQSPIQGILAGLSPILKAPIELHTRSQLDTGIPINSSSEYIGGQMPITSLIQRLTNITPTGDLTKKGQTQGAGNQQNIINYLLGLRLTNTGNYIREAGYEAKQKRKAAAKANAGNPAPVPTPFAR